MTDDPNEVFDLKPLSNKKMTLIDPDKLLALLDIESAARLVVDSALMHRDTRTRNGVYIGYFQYNALAAALLASAPADEIDIAEETIIAIDNDLLDTEEE